MRPGQGQLCFLQTSFPVIAWEELKTKVECIQAPETLSCCIPWTETILASDVTASSSFLLRLLPARPPFTSRMFFKGHPSRNIQQAVWSPKKKKKSMVRNGSKDFTGGPVVQTPRFQCRGHRLIPGLGAKILPCGAAKKRKRHGSNPSRKLKGCCVKRFFSPTPSWCPGGVVPWEFYPHI